MNKTIRMWATVAGLTWALGCGGTETRKDELKQAESSSWDDVPEWADDVPNGCGVGSAKFRGNRSMTRDTSISRARTDLARQLETQVQAMVEDYRAEGEEGGEGFTEEMVTNVSRNITDTTLAGTTVEANYLTDADPPELYSLVCINPEAFVQAFGDVEALSDQNRKALQSRAQKSFENLDSQLEKVRSESK